MAIVDGEIIFRVVHGLCYYPSRKLLVCDRDMGRERGRRDRMREDWPVLKNLASGQHGKLPHKYLG